MKFRFFRYTKIKYFPANKNDYLRYSFFNLFFALIFIANAGFIDNLLNFTKKTPYTLIIPGGIENFEEKKDAIFTRLSLNQDILSVREIEKKIVLQKLKQTAGMKLIDENLMPAIFELTLKNNKGFDLERVNINIQEIIIGSEIFKNNKKKRIKAIDYTVVLTTFSLFFCLLIILQKDYVKKLKFFLKKSRMFGAKDRDLIYDISIGYILFQLIGIFLGYFFIFFLNTEYKVFSNIFKEDIKILIILILLQNLICILSFYYFLKMKLKRIL